MHSNNDDNTKHKTRQIEEPRGTINNNDNNDNSGVQGCGNNT